MRFYGREKEIRALKETAERSKTESQFTVVLGRRRIGKTRLILEAFQDRRCVYLFVNRLNEGILCERMQQSCIEAGIEMPGKMTEFRDILTALMIHSRTDPITVIVDEFQEFDNIDQSIFGDIQEVWDVQKDKARINLIVAGSVHSLMVRIFEDEHQPLFGRPTSKLELRPFHTSVLRRIMEDVAPNHSGEDLLTLFMLTGGVPQYVASLMDSGAVDRDSMLRVALSTGSIFLKDGKDLITAEFGKENKTYLSILQILASGKTKRSEIEDALGITMGEYLKRLEEEYGFIKRRVPVLTDDKRLTRWVISDMYLRFYYRYIQPNQAYIESDRTDLLLRAVIADLESYEGRALEEYFLKMASEEWMYTELGGHWNRNGTMEIDLAVLDSKEGKAILIEVKRNPDKLDLKDLNRKAEALRPLLKGYEVELRGMSMKDVR